MAEIFEIPIDVEDPSFTIRTEIDGKQFLLRFNWNGRMDRWIFSISDKDDNPIVMGMPMHIDWDLLGRFKNALLPDGSLFLFDTTLEHKEAGRDDLGKRAKLLFGRNDAL